MHKKANDFQPTFVFSGRPTTLQLRVWWTDEPADLESLLTIRLQHNIHTSVCWITDGER